MGCAILTTRCRLCGVPFEERLCLDGNGKVWKDMEGCSPENGNPWCLRCLERINRTCEVLCAGVEFSTREQD